MSREKWTTESVGDLSGRVAVITGANTGLGRQTADVMTGKHAEVILAVRSPGKGQVAADEIKAVHPDALVQVMTLDLSDLDSVRSFADEFSGKFSRLDFLINNAGVMMPPYSKTKQGFELQFGTNHLGHFALTGLLMPILKQTGGSRVVTVSSGAHNWGDLDFNDLNWEQREYKAARAYGDSKISNLYFTYELSRHLAGSDPTAVAAHPGWTATDLQRHSKLFSFLNPLFAQKPDMGALPTLRAALDPDVVSGDYFGPRGRREMKGYPVKVESNELSHDESIARRLWDLSCSLTGVDY